MRPYALCAFMILMLVLWVGLGFKLLYDEGRQNGLRHGYQQGLLHGALYYRCQGSLPPMSWQEQARPVDTFLTLDDCWFTEK